MADMYEIPLLKDAVGDLLKNYLTKENVFDLWTFSHDNNVVDMKELCGEFINKNYDRATLINEGKIDLPDLAKWIIKDDQLREGLKN